MSSPAGSSRHLSRLLLGGNACGSKDSLVAVPDEGQSRGERAEQGNPGHNIEHRADSNGVRVTVFVRAHYRLRIAARKRPEEECRREDAVVVLEEPSRALCDRGGLGVGEWTRGHEYTERIEFALRELGEHAGTEDARSKGEGYGREMRWHADCQRELVDVAEQWELVGKGVGLGFIFDRGPEHCFPDESVYRHPEREGLPD